MSVRTTLTKDDTTGAVVEPSSPSAAAPLTPMIPPASMVSDPVDSPVPAGRRALRLARRRRQLVATICALVVAVLLVATIMIVDNARDGPPTPVSSGMVAPAPSGALELTSSAS